MPIPGDLIIFDATIFNPYGHVAIVDKVDIFGIHIYQQNTIFYKTIISRKNKYLLGWLRKENKKKN